MISVVVVTLEEVVDFGNWLLIMSFAILSSSSVKKYEDGLEGGR